jgi:hypothetical protein
MKGKRYLPTAVAKDSGPRGASVISVVFSKILLFILILSFYTVPCYADISGQDVLILVNSNSPTSRYIAKLYRQYHPDVPIEQVLYLSDMNDCSGKTATSGDEIITRDKYNQCIATPVRQYLLDAAHPERIAKIKVIVTTAGMPYRIKDTNPAFDSVVTPAASNGTIVQNNTANITAASVESELTCLWYSDYGSNPFGLENRIVNPYQGYHKSSISLFARAYPGTKTMHWNCAIVTSGVPPKMEGQIDPDAWPPMYGTINRQFNAGDMFFVCRLDGPKLQGQSAIFAVRNMLERAKRASSSSIGVNAAKAVAIFDDYAASSLNRNRIFNLDSSANYWVFDPCVAQPPDAPHILIKDDDTEGYKIMTGLSAGSNQLNRSTMAIAWNTNVILDSRTQKTTTQADIAADELALLLTTYGTNGDEGNQKTYLLTGGPAGGALFNLANGAVFTSMESFNAVTMFSNATTTQAKIIDFITIGGCGAIGHAFEPVSDATIDNLFLFYNLLADNDNDGVADLTFVEAAYSAIPYLSWSEVVIGDPLMRIHYGPGGDQAFDTANCSGDINFDGVINAKDVREFKKAYDGGGDLYNTDSTRFELYNDLADFNHDYKIDIKDVRMLKIEM